MKRKQLKKFINDEVRISHCVIDGFGFKEQKDIHYLQPTMIVVSAYLPDNSTIDHLWIPINPIWMNDKEDIRIGNSIALTVSLEKYTKMGKSKNGSFIREEIGVKDARDMKILFKSNDPRSLYEFLKNSKDNGVKLPKLILSFMGDNEERFMISQS